MEDQEGDVLVAQSDATFHTKVRTAAIFQAGIQQGRL